MIKTIHQMLIVACVLCAAINMLAQYAEEATQAMREREIMLRGQSKMLDELKQTFDEREKKEKDD